MPLIIVTFYILTEDGNILNTENGDRLIIAKQQYKQTILGLGWAQ